MSNYRFKVCLALVLTGMSLFSACETKQPEQVAVPAGDGTVYACRYDNPFSQVSECRAYFGGWTREQVDEECSAVFTGVSGAVSEDPCVDDGAIGICTSNPEPSGVFFKIWFYGGESEVTGRLCGEFLNGTWEDLDGGGGETPQTTTPIDDALEFLNSNEEVSVSPQCLDDECLETMVEAFEGFEFTPLRNEPSIGFIIYPGAQVDPRAYAPIAHEIARNGILSIIVPMPGLFALNGWERATDIIAAHPEIQSWYLGGHSMGGAMTAHFAKENPGIMRGLILWAAYAGGGDNLSDSDEVVASIYGNLDGVATVDEIEEGKDLLPADTHYVEIRGGNHAGFGMYGDQEGDYAADIPLAVQHDQVVGATTHFIRATQMEMAPSINPLFTEAPTTEWCGVAQKIVAAVDAPFESSTLVVNTYEGTEEYARSKPSWDPNAEIPLQLSAYIRDQGNATRLDAPSVMPREIWCKLKSQALLMTEMNTTSVGQPGTCADVNRAAIDWALEQLSDEARARFNALNIEFSYPADEEYETGIEWLGDGQLLVEDVSSESARRFSIRSSSLKVDSQSDVPEADRLPEAFRNVVYCKLMAPAEALRWLLDLGDGTR